jgi:hypothetical protein
MNDYERPNIPVLLEPYLQEIGDYFDLLDNFDDEVALAVKQIFEDINPLHNQLSEDLSWTHSESDEGLALIYFRLSKEIAANMFLSKETLIQTLVFMNNNNYFVTFTKDLQKEYILRSRKHNQNIQTLRNCLAKK